VTALNTQMAEDAGESADELVILDDAIEALARTESALAEIVDLKFFCGLSFAEIAELRGVSERTVQRDWNKARLFLHCALTDDRAS
jgi:DNA-directed RNA polymerase specialized sigma24 family protein